MKSFMPCLANTTKIRNLNFKSQMLDLRACLELITEINILKVTEMRQNFIDLNATGDAR